MKLSPEKLDLAGDRVLVDPIHESEDSIIQAPESAKEKPQFGEVVRVGEACKKSKPGMTAVFGKYAGIEVELSDKKYLLMREDDIWSYLVEEKE